MKNRLGSISHWGISVEELFNKEIFPQKGYSLLELRRAYHDLSTGLRLESIQPNNDIYARYEWVADVVDTDGAKDLGNGYFRMTYVQKPARCSKVWIDKGDAKMAGYAAEDGKRIIYDCPPDGYAIPRDGLFYHPETGAPLATARSQSEAERLLEEYIKQHPEEFAGWTIPFPTPNFLGALQGTSSKPSPLDLARFEVAYYQCPPANAGGVWAVQRGFGGLGPGSFTVLMKESLWPSSNYRGARVRPY